MYALNSLRLEKGYHTWKGNLSSDYSVLEAGLSRFLKLDKPEEFPGKAALTSEKPAKRFATLIVRRAGALSWHRATPAPYAVRIYLPRDRQPP